MMHGTTNIKLNVGYCLRPMRTAFTLKDWLGPLVSDLTVWTKHKDPVSVTVIISFHLLGAQFVPNIQVKFVHSPNHTEENRKNNSINSHKQDTTALWSNVM